MRWKNLASYSSVYFVTATTTDWQPVLMHEEPRGILLADLEFYRRKYGCMIYAYVLMPEHYHLLVDLRDPAHLHNWLRDLQSHSANQISRWLGSHPDLLPLDVFRRHANGSSKLAVWKEQARALEVVSTQVLEVKVDYIHRNPVYRELVSSPDEWPWSSWADYYLDRPGPLRVDRIEL